MPKLTLLKDYLNIGSHSAFGVDFTNDTLKIFQLKSGGKQTKVIGWGRKNLPKNAVQYYEIKERGAFQETFLSCIKEASGKIKGQNVVIALPESKVFTRTITMPVMTQEEAGAAVKYETESNIPVSIDEVYFDWQIVEKDDSSMKVLVMAAPRKVVDNYVDAFQSAGYQVVAVESESVATARSVIKQGDESSIIIVDVGAENTSYAIYQRGYPVFTSSGSVSGKLITDAISKKLGLNIQQAESYKIKVGLGEPEKQNEDIHDVLNPLVSTMVMELQRTINFFEEKLNTDKKKASSIGKIILCGGGSNLKGLVSYLAINLKSEVLLANPWENIDLGRNTPPIPRSISEGFATVIGLAMRAKQYEHFD